MDLTPYVESLREQLAAAADAGGEEARALADRLTGPLESAARLALLEALSAAAGEITRDLAPGSVDLRLRGREPSFVVTPPPAESADLEPDVPSYEGQPRPLTEGDDADLTQTRINLRLTQDLKDRVDEAARAAGLSVNTWLVRAAAAALATGETTDRPAPRVPRGGDHYSGWAR